MAITSFRDEYRFLSNFWPAKVVGPNLIEYPTVEHAYVAYKSDDPYIWESVAELETPDKVKRYGKTIKLRPAWEVMKLSVMRNLVTQKFQDETLYTMLRETAPHELIEGNAWGDTFWGECPIGTGNNHLGKILMSIRDNPLAI